MPFVVLKDIEGEGVRAGNRKPHLNKGKVLWFLNQLHIEPVETKKEKGSSSTKKLKFVLVEMNKGEA